MRRRLCMGVTGRAPQADAVVLRRLCRKLPGKGQSVKKIGYLPVLALRVLGRRLGASLLLTAVAALGVYAGCGLQSLMLRQEQAIEDTIANTVIHCTVTDARGMNADNLGLLSTYIEALLGRRAHRDPTLAGLNAAVTNIHAKGEWELAQPENMTLCRILNLDSDERLAGARVTFAPGWEESDLMQGDFFCLVPEGMETDGFLDIEAAAPLDSVLRLQVAGYISGGPEDVIYCPFFMPWEADVSSTFTIPSCTFDIRDTLRLKECKEKLFSTPYFVVPSVNQTPDGLAMGVLVHDEIYLKSLKELRANLSDLRLLRPLLLILMGGISFFAGFAVNQKRRREFAVMRCLGLRRGAVFRQVLGEQCLMGFLGSALGLGAAFISGQVLSANGLVLSAAVAGMFVLGAAVYAGMAAGGNPMELMKAEE